MHALNSSGLQQHCNTRAYLYVHLNSEDSIAELHGGGLGGGGLGHATPSIFEGEEGVEEGSTRPIWGTGEDH